MIASSHLFQRDWQESLLAHLLRCPALRPHLTDGSVVQEDFDLPVHRYLFQAGREYERVAEDPGPIPMQPLCQQLRAMITGGITMQQELDAIVQAVNNVYHTVEMSPDWYRSSLPLFLKQQRMRMAHKRTEAEGITDPTIVLDRVQRAVSDVTFGSESVVSFPLETFNLAEENPIMVRTTIPAIDHGLGGGLALGELGIICGITGLGKTTFGINFAWGGASSGFEVRFASLELTARKVAARLYSRIAQYPYSLILKGDETNEKSREVINQEVTEQVRRLSATSVRRFRTWDFSTDTCTVDKLRTLIRRDQDAGCPPQMLMVDWLDCLDLPPTNDRNNLIYSKEFRHRVNKHADDLAKLAVSENVAIWAPTQANKIATGKQRVDMTNSSEGFGKSFKCSVFLGIGASNDDREYGIYQVTAAKNRDAPVFTARIRARLDVQTFEEYDEAQVAAAQIMNQRGTQALVPAPSNRQ